MRRKLDSPYDPMPRHQAFAGNGAQNLPEDGREADALKPASVPLGSCTQAVTETFDPVLGDEDLFNPFEAVPGEAYRDQETVGAASIEVPQQDPPAPACERVPFDGAAAVRRVLASARKNTYRELRGEGMTQADMLTAARNGTLKRAEAYLHKAHLLNEKGDPEGASAFGLLFLAAGEPPSQAVSTPDVCAFVSRELIEGLDQASRDILQLAWSGAPPGPLRDLVMGPQFAPTPTPEAEALWNDLNAFAQDPQCQQPLRRLIEASASLLDLQQRARTADAALCKLMWTEALHFRAKQEFPAMRSMAMLYVMCERVPPASPVALSDMVPRDYAMSLGDAFHPPLKLQWL